MVPPRARSAQLAKTQAIGYYRVPTVLRLAGFRFMIFQGDAEHAPAHVHAFKGRTEVVSLLEPVEVRRVNDMKRSDVRAAVRIVEDRQGLFEAAWRKLNG